MLPGYIYMYPFPVVDCGELLPPDNGMVDLSNGTTFGSRAVYSCSDLYNLSGSSNSVCQESGLWSGVIPMCNRKHSACWHKC